MKRRSIGLIRFVPKLFFASLSLSAVSGCATDADGDSPTQGATAPASAAAEMEQHLLTRVSLPGYTVSFYEPEPGLLREFEIGDIDARKPEPSDLDSVQRYEFLTGEKAPSVLVEAMIRAGGDGHVGEPIPTLSVIEAAATEKGFGHGTAQWFWDTYCQKTDRYFGSGPGLVFQNVNTRWRDSVEYLRGGVHVFSGELSYRQGYSGGNIPDQWYELAAGQFAAWRNSSSIDRQASSVVENALGTDNGPGAGNLDQYSHCLNYHY